MYNLKYPLVLSMSETWQLSLHPKLTPRTADPEPRTILLHIHILNRTTDRYQIPPANMRVNLSRPGALVTQ